MTPYFKKLPMRRQYDALGAIRGPDRESRALLKLKSEIVARIRFIVFGRRGDNLAAWRSSHVTAHDLDHIRKAVKRVKHQQVHDHFLSHIRKAIGATTGHPVWGNHAWDILDVL